MRGRASHNSDEVIVVSGRLGISAQVSNSFRVHFGSSVKSKTNLNVLVSEVTVNSLRSSNDLALSVMLGEVLSQQASIGVGVISSDNN